MRNARIFAKSCGGFPGGPVCPPEQPVVRVVSSSLISRLSFLIPFRKPERFRATKESIVTNRSWQLILCAVLVLALAACWRGAQEAATPTSPPAAPPTETVAPTQRPPTAAPAPTVDPASLPVADLQATVTALGAESAIQERNLAAASGSEGASVQVNVDKIKRKIAQLTALIEAAGGAEEVEATEEATTEAGS